MIPEDELLSLQFTTYHEWSRWKIKRSLFCSMMSFLIWILLWMSFEISTLWYIVVGFQSYTSELQISSSGYSTSKWNAWRILSREDCSSSSVTSVSENHWNSAESSQSTRHVRKTIHNTLIRRLRFYWKNEWWSDFCIRKF